MGECEVDTWIGQPAALECINLYVRIHTLSLLLHFTLVPRKSKMKYGPLHVCVLFFLKTLTKVMCVGSSLLSTFSTLGDLHDPGYPWIERDVRCICPTLMRCSVWDELKVFKPFNRVADLVVHLCPSILKNQSWKTMGASFWVEIEVLFLFCPFLLKLEKESACPSPPLSWNF